MLLKKETEGIQYFDTTSLFLSILSITIHEEQIDHSSVELIRYV